MHLENNTTRQWNLTFVINDIIQEQIVHSTPTSTRKKTKKTASYFFTDFELIAKVAGCHQCTMIEYSFDPILHIYLNFVITAFVWYYYLCVSSSQIARFAYFLSSCFRSSLLNAQNKSVDLLFAVSMLLCIHEIYMFSIDTISVEQHHTNTHRVKCCPRIALNFIYVSKVQKVSGVFDVWPCGVSHASAPQLLRVIVAIQLKLQHTKISNSLISTIHIMYAASAGAAVASVGKTRLAVCIFLWHCTTLCWSK